MPQPTDAEFNAFLSECAQAFAIMRGAKFPGMKLGFVLLAVAPDDTGNVGKIRTLSNVNPETAIAICRRAGSEVASQYQRIEVKTSLDS